MRTRTRNSAPDRVDVMFETMATVTEIGSLISRRPEILGGTRALPGRVYLFAGSLSGMTWA